MSSDSGYRGTADAHSRGSEFNAQTLLIKSLMNKMAVTCLVKVMGVDIGAGTVDVRPLVDQIDGKGQSVPHGVIYGLPYVRIQGGACAFVCDPVIGDIGGAIFCMSDISVVKLTKDFALPGSRRRNDWADGLYIGGWLNAAPTSYVEVAPDGINIVSTVKVTVNAPENEFIGASTFTGTVTITDTLTAQAGATVAGNIDIAGNITAATCVIGAGTKFVKLADNTNSTTLKAL